MFLDTGAMHVSQFLLHLYLSTNINGQSNVWLQCLPIVLILNITKHFLQILAKSLRKNVKSLWKIFTKCWHVLLCSGWLRIELGLVRCLSHWYWTFSILVCINLTRLVKKQTLVLVVPTKHIWRISKHKILDMISVTFVQCTNVACKICDITMNSLCTHLYCCLSNMTLLIKFSSKNNYF